MTIIISIVLSFCLGFLAAGLFRGSALQDREMEITILRQQADRLATEAAHLREWRE
jgi:hypothetical protein